MALTSTESPESMRYSQMLMFVLALTCLQMKVQIPSSPSWFDNIGCYCDNYFSCSLLRLPHFFLAEVAVRCCILDLALFKKFVDVQAECMPADFAISFVRQKKTRNGSHIFVHKFLSPFYYSFCSTWFLQDSLYLDLSSFSGSTLSEHGTECSTRKI